MMVLAQLVVEAIISSACYLKNRRIACMFYVGQYVIDLEIPNTNVLGDNILIWKIFILRKKKIYLPVVRLLQL